MAVIKDGIAKISVSMPEGTFELLKEVAQKSDRSVSAVLRQSFLKCYQLDQRENEYNEKSETIFQEELKTVCL